MPFIDALRSDALGVSFTAPASWQTQHDGDSAQWIDPAMGAVWYAIFAPDLHLDLDEAHFASLARDVERHTRYLFERVFEHHPTPQGPRTRDPSWSALVSIERRQIGALSLLHRILYQPGKEQVMGHLLIPVRRGMLELRWVVAERGPTGMRESVLMAKAMNDHPGIDPEVLMRDVRPDDPAHDAAFPMHPLTLARAADRWLCSEAKLHVKEPAKHLTGREVKIDPLRCALTPPTRFVFRGMQDQSALFSRATYSATDGIEWLEVRRIGHEQARAIARQIYEQAQVRNIALHDGASPEHFYVEGDGHLGPLRMACRAVDGWLLAIATNTAQPRESLSQELETTARSLRA